ncbi:MAG: oxygen-dependent coproporphyrinogen oxidase [Gemmataceae bacterium]
MRERAATYFRNLQDRIVATLERLDGQSFHEDQWDRPGGGGGRTRVLVEGGIFEKAGVNFSDVHGQLSEEFAKQIPGQGRDFSACGISLVLHPRNPHVPTVHANFRYLTKGDKWWFGGGADLTPFYPRREDVIHFHRVWRDVCQAHSDVVEYSRLKSWCDEYFHLAHRNEARGVGGIFFDYLDGDPEKVFAFVQKAGDCFLESYVPIVERRKDTPYTPEQKEFQEYRRGRYVEFNLIYDRGTLFGLKTAGRIESILMSLPAKARWWYDYQAPAGTPEAELTEYWLKPRDWANEEIEEKGATG